VIESEGRLKGRRRAEKQRGMEFFRGAGLSPDFGERPEGNLINKSGLFDLSSE